LKKRTTEKFSLCASFHQTATLPFTLTRRGTPNVPEEAKEKPGNQGPIRQEMSGINDKR
jgi:hypothetical protein